MPNSFVDRFDLNLDIDEAKTRFVNRVHNEILWGFLLARHFSQDHQYLIARSVATHLGDRFTNTAVVNFVGDDFLRNLQAIEAIYGTFGNMEHSLKKVLSDTVDGLLTTSERDLGISWKDGKFYPSGAKLLDEKLVNDVMKWLREKKYATVLAPFEKGLRHLLESSKRPELTGDVVTDMYEALEALSKIVTGRETKELSANQEAFIAEVKASASYKKLLRQYIEYAQEFRHAAEQKSPRPTIAPKEAESFAYLTGVFIRLAMF
jgi:hypothetical protein